MSSKCLLNGELKVLEDLGVLPGRQLVIEARGERFTDGLTTGVHGIDMSGEEKRGGVEELERVSGARIEDEELVSPLDKLLLLEEGVVVVLLLLEGVVMVVLLLLEGVVVVVLLLLEGVVVVVLLLLKGVDEGVDELMLLGRWWASVRKVPPLIEDSLLGTVSG